MIYFIYRLFRRRRRRNVILLPIAENQKKKKKRALSTLTLTVDGTGLLCAVAVSSTAGEVCQAAEVAREHNIIIIYVPI